MSLQRPALSLAADRTAVNAIAEFQSATAELLEERPPLMARTTLHVLTAFVVAIVVMATVLPIDRVVTSRGRVTSVAPTIVVQPLETSIIKSLAVREGQIVKAGDVLATLDPTFSTADVSVLERRIASLTAEIDRLNAELGGTPFVPTASSPDAALQTDLFTTRAAQYRAVLASFDQKLAAARTDRDRAEREITLLQERLRLMSEVETMRATLQSKQVGTRMSTIEASNARVEIERAIASQEGALESARHGIEDLEAQRDGFVQKWRSDAASDLVDRQRQLDQANEDYAKAVKRRDLVDLRAVEDAVVLQMGDVSVGSVVQSGERILTLIPVAGGLQVEIDVSARDQGYLKVGQPVELKLDAWRYTLHGTAKGVVRSISGDSFTQKTSSGATGPVFYRALIEITDANLRDVTPDFRLVPGMPLTADVAVGSRTVLQYFLELAMPLMSEGMREP